MIFKDQLQREIVLNEFPQRIISLVPSITELLSDLNLDDEVVGITKFCVHPERWFRTKARIGGTKNINIDLIASLHPQLIIANKEENVKEQIEALTSVAPVYISDINNLNSAIEMIDDIGNITNRKKEAHNIIQKIKSGFQTLLFPAREEKPGMRVCYLIWKDPYMTIGGDTFINDMIERCGFINVFKDKTRYPEVDISQLSSLGCQLLLLSSEPYPFKQKHINELKMQLPGTKIILVDGEMFSWYGSRLQFAPQYFYQLLKKFADN